MVRSKDKNNFKILFNKKYKNSNNKFRNPLFIRFSNAGNKMLIGILI
jgi:hypothetical protein